MSPPSMYRSLRLFAAGLIIFSSFSALTVLYGNQQSRIRSLFYLKGNITNPDAAAEFKVRPESLKDVTNSTLGVRVLVGPWCDQLLLTDPLCSSRTSSSSIFPNDQTSLTNSL